MILLRTNGRLGPVEAGIVGLGWTPKHQQAASSNVQELLLVMKTALRYVIACALPLLAMQAMLAFTDIRVFADVDIASLGDRWQSYKPKTWSFFAQVVGFVVGLTILGIVVSRWKMLFPIAYTILITYGFYQSELLDYPPREPEDVLLFILVYTVLGPMLTIFCDVVTLALTSDRDQQWIPR